MWPCINSPIRDQLTNDILLSIFDKINIIHRRRLSRVCKRWKELIDITFLWVTVFSAVDDRRCISEWQPSHWLGLKFVSRQDYIRTPKVSASDILARVALYLPNLTAIDLECCDMNNRIIRTILTNCKKDWNRLRHVNLSCCTEVNEITARLLIERLVYLESLNLCGTRITGRCLDQLNKDMKRLDISYCWGVQQEGLYALSKAKCVDLEELAVNNFDFDGSESCLISLCNKFVNLKHLQMSIGPCVAHDYFIECVRNKGFSAIGQLKHLETLYIEKICIMDNTALLTILRGCSKLKVIRLNLGWLNTCNDTGFANIDTLLPNLEELHISYPSSLTSASLRGLANLRKLVALSIINTNVDNDIFKFIDKLDELAWLNLNDCRKITIKGFYHLCRIATRRSHLKINVSLIGTGINLNRVKSRKKYPPNLIAKISEFRAPKCVLELPPNM